MHSAAVGGSVPVLRLLLAVAPETALARETEDEDTPLYKALRRGNDEAALYLIGATPAESALEALLWAWSSWRRDMSKAQAQFAEFVITHCPLPNELWQQVPLPCPGLGCALPTALRHSHAQARMLVQHLPPADVAVLQTALLSLVRQQRTSGVALPPLLLERILCMAFG